MAFLTELIEERPGLLICIFSQLFNRFGMRGYICKVSVYPLIVSKGPPEHHPSLSHAKACVRHGISMG